MGVVLSMVLAMQKIVRELPVNKTYLHPAAGDDGLAVGAALYLDAKYRQVRTKPQLFSPYLGPSFSDDEIESAIIASGYEYEKHANDQQLVVHAIDNITRNCVIGWFQGRSEWGPRALGNRSILANPNATNMKDIINAKVKKRESFRPFAPSIIEEDIQLYFEQDIRSPQMMHVVKFKEKWRRKFPSVTHVDWTGRIQSVSHELNPLYYSLLKEMKKKTGHGILLNTSFNENEPVVTTPAQAIACFDRTDIDALYIGKYVLKK